MSRPLKCAIEGLKQLDYFSSRLRVFDCVRPTEYFANSARLGMYGDTTRGCLAPLSPHLIAFEIEEPSRTVDWL